MKSAPQLVPITLEDLNSAAEVYRTVEKRARFYDMARRLVQAGYDVEGAALLLAIWNTGRMRFVGSSFDVDTLEGIFCRELRDDFSHFQDSNIQNIDLKAEGARIARMFDRLSSIGGVEYTGAAKLMHLKRPELFVMWDGYIRGEKPKKLYACLPCNTSGKWSLCRYAKSGEGYVTFLRDMQSRFHDIAYPPANSKTLAKAIDEFYYVNITLVIQLIEDRIEKQKKAQQQK